MTKLEELMQLNGVEEPKDIKEEALCELAEMLAQQEEALLELAEIVGGMSNG